MLFLVITEQLPGKAGYTAEDIYGWGFLLFVTVGVSLIVYAGIQKSKYNIAEYNKENAGMTSREDRLIGMWSGCIMIFATIIFLVAGLVYDLWEKAWIVYVVAAFSVESSVSSSMERKEMMMRNKIRSIEICEVLNRLLAWLR